ncbi:HAD hydrolase-like protein [Candidatus Woesearchaeota archaeon]|nr:HAD hydrolase-like protein [Candidatus Woesearchaeota archaeon]
MDLDDTLIDTWGCITPHLIRQAIREMVNEGLKIDSVETAIKRLTEINNYSKTGEEAIARFLEELKTDQKYLEIGKRGFYNFNFEYEIRTLPGFEEMFTKTDAEFALVSKGDPQAQMEKMKKAGINPALFQKIHIVSKYNKKEYYKEIMEELGFNRENCFVCGDRYETDLLPAKELGIKTIYVQWGRGKIYPPNCQDVNYSITDLKEIVAIVDGEQLKEEIVILQNNSIQVKIYRGDIISILYDNTEFMHGGSKPKLIQTAEDQKGWNKSEIIMFPVIGPLEKYHVVVNNQIIPQDQHGLARYIPFEIIESQKDRLHLKQNHSADQLVQNIKFSSDKTRPPLLSWPFSYVIEKEIYLNENKIRVDFTIKNYSQDKMPFMFGWHPAFKTLGDKNRGIFHINNEKYPLSSVIKASQENIAMLIENAHVITYINEETKQGITISSAEFPKTMLWCPDDNSPMFCIEPVTKHPAPKESQYYFNKTDQGYGEGIEYLAGGESKRYSIILSPLKEISGR